ncbi:hypothetical protein Tco_1336855 [Tanacetum coccineum]
MTLATSTSTDKSLKDFDEFISTLIDFSGYILNGLKIENLTQEILLGLAFRLLKGTRSNYAKLEYNFEEYYKVLSSFETAGLRPETDHLSPSYDLLKKGSFFTRSWASRNKIARSSILGPASNFDYDIHDVYYQDKGR